MATDWKTLTPEQKAEINRKRREKYKTLPLDEKLAYREKKKAQYEPKKLDDSAMVRFADGTTKEITNPLMIRKLAEINQRVRRRKIGFQNRMGKIQEWRDAGGKWPPPNIKKRMEITELWAKIAFILGRRCCQCGTADMFDPFWRLCPKEDFLAFVPFTKEAYERVLANPGGYEIYCVRCTFDLRLIAFHWLFSPYSPRRNRETSIPFKCGDRYRNWETRFPEMYPENGILFDWIRSGRIKSLSCGIKGPDGNFLPTFLRKREFYSNVGAYPRRLWNITMESAAQFYKTIDPSLDVRMWGIGRIYGRFGESVPETDAISEDLKQFFMETKPDWQKGLSVARVGNPQ